MKKTVLSLTIVLLLTAALLVVAFFGIELGSFQIKSVDEGISLGLDLVGGSEIAYQAVVPDGTSDEELAQGMETAKTMLRQRLNNLGFTEANVYLSGTDLITVEIPNVSNPEEAVQMLGTTAQIQFVDYEGKVILEGEDIAGAEGMYGELSQNGLPEYYVKLQLSATGYEKFVDATAEVASYSNGNNFLAIVMDGEEISKPYVGAEYAGKGIDTDSPVITLGSDATAESSRYLAEIIKSGQMPFQLQETKLQSVGASLGEKSLESSILAGIIGIALVMLYMLIVYRVPGLVADIALMLYVALFLVVMSVTKLNLSLPGIAGIILTIGMAVDANVIIFERMREELNAGKTLKSSVALGFKRAYTAIIDSNVTTIIAGVVLLWQGTGTILGFAKTLMIGVVLSMICMLTVPHLLLRAIATMKHKNLRAFGLKKEGK